LIRLFPAYLEGGVGIHNNTLIHHVDKHAFIRIKRNTKINTQERHKLYWICYEMLKFRKLKLKIAFTYHSDKDVFIVLML